MVRKQIERRGVKDPRVLEAFRTVPREAFFNQEQRQHAFDDVAFPIGCDQTISQPYMVACMTEILDLKPTDRVLEIGTGSGYQTAILAALVAEVYTIERHRTLQERAKGVLAEIGATNVHYSVGDGTLGWPEQAPYDAILVTAGAPHVPEPLKEQLADGGRLLIPVGSRAEQVLTRVVRTGDAFHLEKGIACRFVPLVGAAGWKSA